MTLRAFLRVGVAVLALGAGGLSVWAWQQSESHPMTDAATVDAPVVEIAAIVPGLVIEVAVENNDHVEAGELLFRLDPEVYDLELQQARAALAAAESELRQGEGNRALEQSNADVASSQIDRAEANLTLARQTLMRLEPLLEQGYVTAQQVDSARTAVRDAEVTLQQARSHASGTGAFVGTLDTRRAQVESARAAVALAERNRRNTEIHAPRAGYIAGLTMTTGEFVVTAAPLFSLIDDSEWRVTALFRETDLPQIALGDSVRVFLLAAPSTPIRGRVTGVGWGVRSNDEAQLLGLPLVASKLDWVRAARRFPVEIELEDAPAGLVRLGASASVRILGVDADAAQ
ncbi:HlyD family efflux transporter periplasmic adaptor subunit [Pararhodobacter zhoushanensis]|uniref:Biotin/lipoyl-binding protein n=1 Tax=Pararhodobacter zhoushanensis TaxID=2479545 RepID=A0ABT3H1S6_9RHOB|nr:biotin/lipoyl-binding protein [Pararhodobacter zhoushanensis]MCW1933758.1 biotin/lipoyl-binding protein [Pararhodobacter zhoushanensis]